VPQRVAAGRGAGLVIAVTSGERVTMVNERLRSTSLRVRVKGAVGKLRRRTPAVPLEGPLAATGLKQLRE
jgi:hypothetical protein